MNDNAIAVASSNFIHDEAHENGLMIMGLPTGIGKTHGNCVMMLDEVTNSDDISFIYITEQNKNIEDPYNKLKKIACDKNGNYKWSVDEFNEKVLWLKSNVDMFDQGYKDDMRFPIYDCFAKFGVDKGILNRLLDARKAYKRAKSKHLDKDYQAQLYEAYRGYEADLRKELHKILKQYPGRDSKLKHIESVPELNWIADVYKVIRFKDARIIMMSDKKFTDTIDPIVSAPFCIWEETDLRVQNGKRYSQLNSHILVIDEFDTFKSVLEGHLVDENLKQVDAVRAFRNCSLRLPAWKNLPDDIQKESTWWEKEGKKFSIEDRFKNIVEKGNKIKSDFRMQHLFKLFGVDSDGEYTDPPSSSFMFRDYEPNTVGTAFTLKTEDGDKYNRILTGKNITAKQTKMTSLFKALDSYFGMLCRLVRDLSFNYKSNLEANVAKMVEKKNPLKYGEEERSGLINCVESVIDALDMEDDLAKYVKNRVLHNRLSTDKDRTFELLEPTMFSRGFKYVDMKDSINRQLQTHLFYTDYDTTPEYILRHICEVTKVIGMSATGEIESPLCNFSLQYLRESGVHIHEYPASDIKALDELMKKNKRGYINGDAKVDVQILDADVSYSQMSWESMFDQTTAKKIFNKIGHVSDKESEDYPETRYVRAAKVFEEFIQHKDIQSMLCFFSAHAKSIAGSTFLIEKINFVLERLAEKHNVKINVEWAGEESISINPEGKDEVTLMQITSENYDDVKDRMFEKLANNEKVLVLTAYQTLGAGQNLQYKIPKDVPESELVWVRGPEGQKTLDSGEAEKDFDAIYLDDPRSIGPKVEKNDKASLDHYLFYVEYADAVGKIELDDKRKQIAQAFMYCYNPAMPGHPKHFKNTEIYILSKGQTVVQAIGRADRTGWKRKVTHIFLDKQLAYGGVFGLDKEQYGMHRSQLFDEVYDAVHKPVTEDEDMKLRLLVNNAVRKSHCIVCRIDDIREVMYGGDPTAINEWKVWRDFVLKHPTGPKNIDELEALERELYIYGYVDLPAESDTYWFSQKEDFRNDSTDGLEVYFKEPKKLKRSDVTKVIQSVSSKSARLDLMLRIDGVREFMEKNGYATRFDSNMRIMSPPLFRNIYMGALGEVVGQFLLENDFGLKGHIKEMEGANYEQFDNMLDSGAAIDFKDWNEYFLTDGKAREWQLKKISRKMARCGISRVYILNVVLDSDAEYQPVIREPVENGEIIIVPYLYKVGAKGNTFNDKLEKLLEQEMKE